MRLWRPRYNLGRSRAGGHNAPDGWYIYSASKGWYGDGSSQRPFYTEEDAKRACDTMNRSIRKKASRKA